MTASTMHLYEIAEAREILDQWLLESEGELTPEIEALLAEIDEKADTKIERVALYIREQKALAAAAKEELGRVAAVIARRNRAADSLTLYLQREMERLGKDKVAGLLCTVAIQQNPPSVKGELTPEALSELFESSAGSLVRHIPASFALDKKAIIELHKAGEPLPDGLTVERSSSVRIR